MATVGLNILGKKSQDSSEFSEIKNTKVSTEQVQPEAKDQWQGIVSQPEGEASGGSKADLFAAESSFVPGSVRSQIDSALKQARSSYAGLKLGSEDQTDAWIQGSGSTATRFQRQLQVYARLKAASFEFESWPLEKQVSWLRRLSDALHNLESEASDPQAALELWIFQVSEQIQHGEFLSKLNLGDGELSSRDGEAYSQLRTRVRQGSESLVGRWKKLSSLMSHEDLSLVLGLTDQIAGYEGLQSLRESYPEVIRSKENFFVPDSSEKITELKTQLNGIKVKLAEQGSLLRELPPGPAKVQGRLQLLASYQSLGNFSEQDFVRLVNSWVRQDQLLGIDEAEAAAWLQLVMAAKEFKSQGVLSIEDQQLGELYAQGLSLFHSFSKANPSEQEKVLKLGQEWLQVWGSFDGRVQDSEIEESIVSLKARMLLKLEQILEGEVSENISALSQAKAWLMIAAKQSDLQEALEDIDLAIDNFTSQLNEAELAQLRGLHGQVLLKLRESFPGAKDSLDKRIFEFAKDWHRSLVEHEVSGVGLEEKITSAEANWDSAVGLTHFCHQTGYVELAGKNGSVQRFKLDNLGNDMDASKSTAPIHLLNRSLEQLEELRSLQVDWQFTKDKAELDNQYEKLLSEDSGVAQRSQSSQKKIKAEYEAKLSELRKERNKSKALNQVKHGQSQIVSAALMLSTGWAIGAMEILEHLPQIELKGLSEEEQASFLKEHSILQTQYHWAQFFSQVQSETLGELKKIHAQENKLKLEQDSKDLEEFFLGFTQKTSNGSSIQLSFAKELNLEAWERAKAQKVSVWEELANNSTDPKLKTAALAMAAIEAGRFEDGADQIHELIESLEGIPEDPLLRQVLLQAQTQLNSVREARLDRSFEVLRAFAKAKGLPLQGTSYASNDARKAGLKGKAAIEPTLQALAAFVRSQAPGGEPWNFEEMLKRFAEECPDKAYLLKPLNDFMEEWELGPLVSALNDLDSQADVKLAFGSLKPLLELDTSYWQGEGKMQTALFEATDLLLSKTEPDSHLYKQIFYFKSRIEPKEKAGEFVRTLFSKETAASLASTVAMGYVAGLAGNFFMNLARSRMAVRTIYGGVANSQAWGMRAAELVRKGKATNLMEAEGILAKEAYQKALPLARQMIWEGSARGAQSLEQVRRQVALLSLPEVTTADLAALGMRGSWNLMGVHWLPEFANVGANSSTFHFLGDFFSERPDPHHSLGMSLIDLGTFHFAMQPFHDWGFWGKLLLGGPAFTLGGIIRKEIHSYVPELHLSSEQEDPLEVYTLAHGMAYSMGLHFANGALPAAAQHRHEQRIKTVEGYAASLKLSGDAADKLYEQLMRTSVEHPEFKLKRWVRLHQRGKGQEADKLAREAGVNLPSASFLPGYRALATDGYFSGLTVDGDSVHLHGEAKVKGGKKAKDPTQEAGAKDKDQNKTEKPLSDVVFNIHLEDPDTRHIRDSLATGLAIVTGAGAPLMFYAAVKKLCDWLLKQWRKHQAGIATAHTLAGALTAATPQPSQAQAPTHPKGSLGDLIVKANQAFGAEGGQVVSLRQQVYLKNFIDRFGGRTQDPETNAKVIARGLFATFGMGLTPEQRKVRGSPLEEWIQQLDIEQVDRKTLRAEWKRLMTRVEDTEDLERPMEQIWQEIASEDQFWTTEIDGDPNAVNATLMLLLGFSLDETTPEQYFINNPSFGRILGASERDGHINFAVEDIYGSPFFTPEAWFVLCEVLLEKDNSGRGFPFKGSESSLQFLFGYPEISEANLETIISKIKVSAAGKSRQLTLLSYLLAGHERPEAFRARVLGEMHALLEEGESLSRYKEAYFNTLSSPQIKGEQLDNTVTFILKEQIAINSIGEAFLKNPNLTTIQLTKLIAACAKRTDFFEQLAQMAHHANLNATLARELVESTEFWRGEIPLGFRGDHECELIFAIFTHPITDASLKGQIKSKVATFGDEFNSQWKRLEVLQKLSNPELSLEDFERIAVHYLNHPEEFIYREYRIKGLDILKIDTPAARAFGAKLKARYQGYAEQVQDLLNAKAGITEDTSSLTADLEILADTLGFEAPGELRAAPHFNPHLNTAHQLLHRLVWGLSINRFVLLSGDPATGKSEVGAYLAEQLGWTVRSVNAHPEMDEATLMQELGVRYNEKSGKTQLEVRDGVLARALENGELLVLNEIHRAKPGALAFLFTILGDKDQTFAYYDAAEGEIVQKNIHPNFKMIATRNVGEGLADLNPALKNRAIEIYANEYSEGEMKALLKSKHPSFGELKGDLAEGDQYTVADGLVAFWIGIKNNITEHSIGQKGEPPVWSLRQLLSMAGDIERLGEEFSGADLVKVFYERVAISLSPEERHLIFDEMENHVFNGVKVSKEDIAEYEQSLKNASVSQVLSEHGVEDPQALMTQFGVVDIPTSGRYLGWIISAMERGDHLYLEGPAGTGKSQLARLAAYALGGEENVFGDTLSAQTDSAQLKSELRPKEFEVEVERDGKKVKEKVMGFEEVPGQLLSGLRRAQQLAAEGSTEKVTVILDEAGFARADVMEELHGLLDRDGGIWIYNKQGEPKFLKRSENFCLVMIGNEYGYSGVKLKSRATRSRTQLIHMGFEYTAPELGKIFQGKGVAESEATALGELLAKAAEQTQDSDSNNVISLRQVNQISDYLKLFGPKDDAPTPEARSKAIVRALWLALGAKLTKAEREGEAGRKIQELIKGLELEGVEKDLLSDQLRDQVEARVDFDPDKETIEDFLFRSAAIGTVFADNNPDSFFSVLIHLSSDQNFVNELEGRPELLKRVFEYIEAQIVKRPYDFKTYGQVLIRLRSILSPELTKKLNEDLDRLISSDYAGDQLEVLNCFKEIAKVAEDKDIDYIIEKISPFFEQTGKSKEQFESEIQVRAAIPALLVELSSRASEGQITVILDLLYKLIDDPYQSPITAAVYIFAKPDFIARTSDEQIKEFLNKIHSVGNVDFSFELPQIYDAVANRAPSELIGTMISNLSKLARYRDINTWSNAQRVLGKLGFNASDGQFDEILTILDSIVEDPHWSSEYAIRGYGYLAKGASPTQLAKILKRLDEASETTGQSLEFSMGVIEAYSLVALHVTGDQFKAILSKVDAYCDKYKEPKEGNYDLRFFLLDIYKNISERASQEGQLDHLIEQISSISPDDSFAAPVRIAETLCDLAKFASEDQQKTILSKIKEVTRGIIPNAKTLVEMYFPLFKHGYPNIIKIILDEIGAKFKKPGDRYNPAGSANTKEAVDYWRKALAEIDMSDPAKAKIVSDHLADLCTYFSGKGPKLVTQWLIFDAYKTDHERVLADLEGLFSNSEQLKDTEEDIQSRASAAQLLEAYQDLQILAKSLGKTVIVDELTASTHFDPTLKTAHQLLHRLVWGLSINRFVLLSGDPATGKSEVGAYLAEQLGWTVRSVNAHPEMDEASLMQELGVRFVEKTGKTQLEVRDGVLARALENGELLVLNEIHRAKPGALAFFNNILGDKDQTFTYYDAAEGEPVQKKIHPNFKMIATRNVGEGLADINAALKTRAIEINANEYSEGELKALLKGRYSKFGELKDGESYTIADGLVAFWIGIKNNITEHSIGQKGEPPVWSLRQLLSMAGDIERLGEDFSGADLVKVFYERVAISLRPEERRLIFDEMENHVFNGVKVSKEDIAEYEQSLKNASVSQVLSEHGVEDPQGLMDQFGVVDIPTSGRYLGWIINAMERGDHLYLEGPAGTGKSQLARLAAYALGGEKNVFGDTLSAQTDSAQLKSELRPKEFEVEVERDGKKVKEKVMGFEEVPGALLRGLRRAQELAASGSKEKVTVILDEAGFARPDVMEELHGLLDRDGGIWVYNKQGEPEFLRRSKNFCLIMIGNEYGYSGVKLKSRATRSRTQLIHMGFEYTAPELARIFQGKGVAESEATALGELLAKAAEQAKESGSTNVISLRQVNQISDYLKLFGPKDDAPTPEARAKAIVRALWLALGMKFSKAEREGEAGKHIQELIKGLELDGVEEDQIAQALHNQVEAVFEANRETDAQTNLWKLAAEQSKFGKLDGHGLMELRIALTDMQDREQGTKLVHEIKDGALNDRYKFYYYRYIINHCNLNEALLGEIVSAIQESTASESGISSIFKKVLEIKSLSDEFLRETIIPAIENSNMNKEMKVSSLNDVLAHPNVNETVLEKLISSISTSEASINFRTQTLGRVGGHAKLGEESLAKILLSIEKSGADEYAIVDALNATSKNPNITEEFINEKLLPLIDRLALSGYKKVYSLSGLAANSNLSEDFIAETIIPIISQSEADGRTLLESLKSFSNHVKAREKTLKIIINAIQKSGADEHETVRHLGELGSHPHANEAVVEKLIPAILSSGGRRYYLISVALSELSKNHHLTADFIKEKLFPAIHNLRNLENVYYKWVGSLGELGSHPNADNEIINEIFTIIETSGAPEGVIANALGKLSKNPKLTPDFISKKLFPAILKTRGSKESIDQWVNALAQLATNPKADEGVLKLIIKAINESGKERLAETLGNIRNNSSLTEDFIINTLIPSIKNCKDLEQTKAETIVKIASSDASEAVLASIIETVINLESSAGIVFQSLRPILEHPKLTAKVIEGILLPYMKEVEVHPSWLVVGIGRASTHPGVSEVALRELIPLILKQDEPWDSASLLGNIVKHPNCPKELLPELMEKILELSDSAYIQLLAENKANIQRYREEVREEFASIQTRVEELESIKSEDLHRISYGSPAGQELLGDLATLAGLLGENDSNINESPQLEVQPHFDPTLKTAHQLLHRLVWGLSINRFVLLSGDPATGKSEVGAYLAEQLGWTVRSVNAHPEMDEATLMQELGVRYNEKSGKTQLEVRDGVLARALENGELLVLNEIHRAKPGALAFLFTILGDKDQTFAYYDAAEGEIVQRNIHPNFKMIATRNVGEGLADLNPALKNRAIEIYANEYSEGELKALLKGRYSKFGELKDGESYTIADGLVAFWIGIKNNITEHSIGQKGEPPVWSLRQLLSMAGDIERLGEDFSGADLVKVFYERVAISLRPEERRLIFDEMENHVFNGVKVSKEDIAEYEQSLKNASVSQVLSEHGVEDLQGLMDQFGVVDIPTSGRYLGWIISAMERGDHLYLEGPAGTGKSQLAKLAAYALGGEENVFGDTLSAQTDSAQLKSELRPREFELNDGAKVMGFEEVPGALLSGLRRAQELAARGSKEKVTVILDEAGFARPDVMEELHGLLDRDGGIWVYNKQGEPEFLRRTDNFCLVMIGNEYGYSGVKLKSRATRSRTQLIHMDFEYEGWEIDRMLGFPENKPANDPPPGSKPSPAPDSPSATPAANMPASQGSPAPAQSARTGLAQMGQQIAEQAPELARNFGEPVAQMARAFGGAASYLAQIAKLKSSAPTAARQPEIYARPDWVYEKLKGTPYEASPEEARELEAKFDEFQAQIRAQAVSVAGVGIEVELDPSQPTMAMTLGEPHTLKVGPRFLKEQDKSGLIINALHEGVHAEITKVLDGFFFQPGKAHLSALHNAVEDLRVDARAIDKAPGRREAYVDWLYNFYSKGYDQLDTDQIPNKLPHEAYMAAIMAKEHTKENPYLKVPGVAEAIEETWDAIQRIKALRPDKTTNKPSRAQVMQDAQEMDKILKEEILPVYERLYQQSVEQVSKAIEQAAQDGKLDQMGLDGAQMQAGPGSTINPKDLSDAAKKILDARAKKINAIHAPKGTVGDNQQKVGKAYQDAHGEGKPKSGEPKPGKPNPYEPGTVGHDLHERQQQHLAQKAALESKNYSKRLWELKDLPAKVFRVFDQLLKPNEDFTYEGHFTRGARLDVKRAIQLIHGLRSDLKIFKRKVMPTERDYRFGMVIDASGSMADGGAREKGGLGMGSMFVDVFERLKLPYSLDFFHNDYIPAKGFEDRLPSTQDRDQFFNQIVVNDWGQGGTNLRAGLKGALERTRKARGADPKDHEIIFVLTDGEETHGEGKTIRQMCEEAAKEGIIVVGIGIGEGMKTVRDQFPIHIVETNPENLPNLMSEFIKEYVQSQEEGGYRAVPGGF